MKYYMFAVLLAVFMVAGGCSKKQEKEFLEEARVDIPEAITDLEEIIEESPEDL